MQTPHSLSFLQEILALKDQANAVQADAQMQTESLAKQLEEKRVMVAWLEGNNLEITKQNANLVKEVVYKYFFLLKILYS